MTEARDVVTSAQKRRELREQILELTRAYVELEDGRDERFRPGRSVVNYAGRVYDAEEVTNLVASSLDFWLTEGRYAAMFEKALTRFVGVEYCRLVNSGSSANLAAFYSLTSRRLGDRRVEKGDEVVTLAAGFPTTVAPLVQYGAVPVFVDIEPRTGNVDVEALAAAIGPRTKAVMIAHTLGNPFDLDAVMAICRQHNLWLIEDNCDALGATYDSALLGKELHTGAFGDLATSSFYPPHHITTGEGGAVYTSNEEIDSLIGSFRDWGRDCYCRSGRDNTCGLRFEQQFGSLPFGYDHKYVYSHFGFNLKMTDLQASIGLAQVKKLPSFVEARRANYAYLRAQLPGLEEFFDFTEPTEKSNPSWFGMLMTVRDDAPFRRADVVGFLESARIQTRMLFAGNLLKHPCFDELHESGTGYRIVGELRHTDRVMERAFWLGVYPGMSEIRLDYMAEKLREFCSTQVG